MIRLERHALGPRCFVLGRRLHEWHVGAVSLAAGAALAMAGLTGLGLGAIATGLWLVLKDANDLIPSRRNTAAWSLGIHRRPLALRERPRAAWLPVLIGWLVAAFGAANVISVLTPELPRRMAPLAHLAPREAVLAAHAAVLPAGLALLVLSTYLVRRRRRAVWLAIGVLTGLGGLELLKGLDLGEALASWALAGLLAWGRDAFTVRHDDGTLATALRRAGLALGVGVTATAAAVLVASHGAAPATLVVRETLALLTLSAGPMTLGPGFAWLPLAAALLAGGGLLAAAWAVFKPLRATDVSTRDGSLARTLVRRHGHDTLSTFKLRRDLDTLIAPDGRAFLSYRVENGVLLVSGDPVGADDALPGLLRHLTCFAAQRGLRIGAVGASAGFAALARDAGLRALYLGDEAIVATAGFSLAGHSIKKVRQACNRIARSGITAELRLVGALEPAEVAELAAISDRWRAGAPERGFSMAMDTLDGEHLADSVVLVARDAEGHARGFLHFVPAHGRPAMSLSAMRRDRDTPNGLTDFMVVRAIQLMEARGIEELSLNFAAFARWMQSPAGRGERLLGAIVRRGDRYFQIESLYRFNAKYSPRWQPRYLLYDGARALPRTVLAALRAEGQLPTAPLPSRWGRKKRQTTSAATIVLAGPGSAGVAPGHW